MDFREKIARYPGSSEERLLLSHVADLLERGRMRSVPVASGFLSEHEQALVKQLLPELSPSFWGGAEGLARAVCFYLPDYLDDSDLMGEGGPVVALRAAYAEREALSHRDFLGALMGLGITRDCVGDLLLSPGHCDFFVTRTIAPFVLQNLSSAGRTSLQLSELPLSEVIVPQVSFALRRDTVASLRMDAVLSSAFGLSREKAAQAVSARKVSRNGMICEKPDQLVVEGDIFSIRGSGKAALEEVGGKTKKGRIAIVIRKYL